jgi:hypothetical protein
MGLAKISQNSADALRDILDAPPPPGLSPVHTTDEPGRRFPVIMGKVRTPIVPKDSIGGGVDHSAAGQFNAIANEDTHPIDDADTREPVTGVALNAVVCAGDQTSVAVAGTRIAIDGSTGNDGWYELRIDPTYDPGADETTFSVREDFPDLANADGEICLPSAWIPDTKSNVYTASAHSPVAAFAGDHVAFAQIHGEFVPIAGPQIIFGYLKATLEEPAIANNVLTPTSAAIRVCAFDSDDVWADTGIERTVYNLWDGVMVDTNTLVTAQRMSNRWIVTAVGCGPTTLTFE